MFELEIFDYAELLEIEMFLKIKLCTYAKLKFFEIELFIYIKIDLALNNLQRLIWHKDQTNQTKPNSLPEKVDF